MAIVHGTDEELQEELMRLRSYRDRICEKLSLAASNTLADWRRELFITDAEILAVEMRLDNQMNSMAAHSMVYDAYKIA